ncbi:MAG: TIM barrel protein [Elusimicrobiota bacterium]
MLLGAHFSIRKSLGDALAAAAALGCEVVQTLGYRRHEFYFDAKIAPGVKERLADEVAEWRRVLAASNIRYVAIHSRAVALLSLKEMARRAGAIDNFQKEIELARLLGASAYVFHLGPYTAGLTREEGVTLAARSLVHVLRELPKGAPQILLENVPGGGRRLGATIEEIASLVEQLGASAGKVGICLDVAHTWTAGYAIDTLEGIAGFFEKFKQHLDLGMVKAFHLNNSKLKRGCHLDEHAHLQDGVVKPEVYAYLMRGFPLAAGILETPKEPEGSDKRNLDFLRSLDDTVNKEADWSRGGSNP